LEGETIMKTARYLLAAAAAITVTSGSAFAQFAPLPGGRIYPYHTAPTFPCPGMDWLLTTGENGSISGIVAWDQKNSVARAVGSINKDGQVQITATEIGGQGRTATITGTVDAKGWLVLNITGPNVKCDGINVPYWTP
jgi:hypothetical protein